MENPRNTPTNNLYHALGRIEGKIDGFVTQLSEHSTRVDVIEQIVGENARRVAVHEERISNLEERPDMSSDIQAIKNRLTYALGAFSVIGTVMAFAAPYLVKQLWGL